MKFSNSQIFAVTVFHRFFTFSFEIISCSWLISIIFFCHFKFKPWILSLKVWFLTQFLTTNLKICLEIIGSFAHIYCEKRSLQKGKTPSNLGDQIIIWSVNLKVSYLWCWIFKKLFQQTRRFSPYLHNKSSVRNLIDLKNDRLIDRFNFLRDLSGIARFLNIARK